MARQGEDIELLAFVSDLHCGSTYGLLPPGFVSAEQNEICQNLVQQWLWWAWCDVWKRFFEYAGGRRWALVVNGDAIEGDHHGTKELISIDEGDHLAAAYDTLKPLAEKAAAVFVVEGTECHTKGHEHALAKMLGAVPDATSGRHAWKRLQIAVRGTPLVAQHHIGTSTRVWLRTGEPGRAVANEQLEAVRVGDVVPKILVAGHCHQYVLTEMCGAMAITTPAWQALTRYGRKVVPSARLQVGMVALDWKGVPDGELPRAIKFLRSTAESRWPSCSALCHSPTEAKGGLATKSAKSSSAHKRKR